MRSFACLLCVALLALSTAARSHAQTFTYQGQLSTAGSPENTPHDFQFRIFTLSAGGVQVGSTTTALGLPVTNGVFTASISPGTTVFTGSERWLEVAVRPAGSPTYTTLTPRQRIAAAPYAVRSLSERLVDIGGGILTNNGPVDGSTINRMILNRTTPITGADFFTLRTPTGQQQFGGMYIDTAASDGFPFYGFATGGNVRSFAYVDGTNGAFKLSISGDRVTVSNTGLVGVGTEPTGPERLQISGDVKATGVVTASDLSYAAPKTRTMSIPIEAFRSEDGSKVLSFTAGYATFAGNVTDGVMVAPVILPHGATISSFDATLRINTGTEPIRVYLTRRTTRGTDRDDVAFLSVNTPTNGAVTLNSQSFFPSVVNNELYVYHVRFECSNWNGFNKAVYGCRIRYTVPAPD